LASSSHPDLEGIGVAPVLADPERAAEIVAFSMVSPARAGIGGTLRTERCRYTDWPDGSVELYDMNVAASPVAAGCGPNDCLELAMFEMIQTHGWDRRCHVSRGAITE
jgi:hypothetical protein